jgi:hypothetical protein
MRRTLTVAAAGTLALALLLGTTGCTRVKLQDLPQTRAETLDKTVALDGATSLRTEIMQGVGELTVTGLETSSTAMTGRFVYAPADWKPEVSYSATGGVGTLAIRQPAHTDVQLFEHSENTWDVRLAKGIPTDLKLTLGVGTSDIDLRGVDLTSLDVVNGVGETKIDLSGARATGFSGSIAHAAPATLRRREGHRRQGRYRRIRRRRREGEQRQLGQRRMERDRPEDRHHPASRGR